MSALEQQQEAVLTRDDEHRYWINGTTPIRGVNETIEQFIAKSPWIEEWYRDRGSLAHDAIKLALRNDLDWDTLDPELAPFVKAALLFMADTGWKPVAIEEKLYSPTLWVAGEPDLVTLMPGRRPMHAIVDWKLGGPCAPYQLQTAGYKLIVEENGLPIDRRLCVHLRRDGTYRVRTHRNARDLVAFTGMAQALAWKEIELGAGDE
jgi:hypothetical protein